MERKEVINCAVIISIAIFAIMAIVICSQFAKIQPEVTDLPDCPYSSVINIEGQHEGWWVGVDENHNPVCINRLDQWENSNKPS